jgi:hypothetical protein
MPGTGGMSGGGTGSPGGGSTGGNRPGGSCPGGRLVSPGRKRFVKPGGRFVSMSSFPGEPTSRGLWAAPAASTIARVIKTPS